MSFSGRIHVFEVRVRTLYCDYLSLVEVCIYILLGTLLAVAAFLGIAGASSLMLNAFHAWAGTEAVFDLIDRLLLVLMLLEILHTLRISIRSHRLVVEPFLVVGLIASIRRTLVLTMQAESLTSKEHWADGGKPIFDASMIELCVLALVIAVLVATIFVMRQTKPSDDEYAHEETAH